LRWSVYASLSTINKEHNLGMRFWLFVIVVGGLAHLVLYLADREINAGIDRLSEAKLARPELLVADPDLKLASTRSPYMRDER
jgi:hypothetical protein